MRTWLESIDNCLINTFRRYADEFARIALFIIFFWFGILKVFGLSPAGPLIHSLLEVTFLSPLSPDQFTMWFGAFEAITGVLILTPKFERITFTFLGLHLITTALPLFLLPEITWVIPGLPATLTGQYIFENLALISVGLLLYARLTPIKKLVLFGVKRTKILNCNYFSYCS